MGSLKLTELEAKDFFSELYYGAHHIPSNIKPFGYGQRITYCGDIATFDSNFLTRLVFLAHDKGYRASISPSSRGMLGIEIWKRSREGSLYEKHPTLEEAMKEWRIKHK